MADQKLPMAGEWWQRGPDRIYIVWRSLDNVGYQLATYGPSTGQAADRLPLRFIDWSQWDYLPNCTSLDWETDAAPYPRWYISKDSRDFYIRRDSAKQYVIIDGLRQHSGHWGETMTKSVFQGKLLPVPHSEALDWVKDPDEWVTQDRCPPRNFIDQWCWLPVDKQPQEADWQSDPGDFLTSKHGDLSCDISGRRRRLHVRCHRGHLPALSSETERVISDMAAGIAQPLSTEIKSAFPTKQVLKLWVSKRALTEGSDWPVRASAAAIRDASTWVELKWDGTQFYVDSEE